MWVLHSQLGITTDRWTLNVWKPWIDHQRSERRRSSHNTKYQQYIQRCVYCTWLVRRTIPHSSRTRYMARERTTSKGSVWATWQTETQTWSDVETEGHTEGQQNHRLGTQFRDCEEKDGSLRQCLDPRELNKAIKQENFQIPTVEEVTCRLSDKMVFTVIDLKARQVLLPEERASLITFNTLFGILFSSECPLDFAQRQKLYRRECTKQLVTLMMCTWLQTQFSHCVQQRRRSWSHTHQCVQASPKEEREVQHREIAAQEIESELHGQHNRFQRSEARPIQRRSNCQYARTRGQERHSASDRNA